MADELATPGHENIGEEFTGAMPIRFYGPVGNGFSFDLLRTLRFSKGIPFLGSARRPIPTRPFARPVHFHGKKSHTVIASPVSSGVAISLFLRVSDRRMG